MITTQIFSTLVLFRTDTHLPQTIRSFEVGFWLLPSLYDWLPASEAGSTITFLLFLSSHVVRLQWPKIFYLFVTSFTVWMRIRYYLSDLTYILRWVKEFPWNIPRVHKLMYLLLERPDLDLDSRFGTKSETNWIWYLINCLPFLLVINEKVDQIGAKVIFSSCNSTSIA